MDSSAFSRGGIYTRCAPPSAIAEDMRAVRRIDHGRARSRRVWTWLLGLGLAATLGLLLACRVDPGRLSAYYPGAGLALVFAVVAYGMRRRSGKLDIEDRRYALVTRLMRYLAADMPSGQPLAVTVDFRKIDHGDKRTGTGKQNGWKVESFRDPWLQIRGRFADGTRFAIQLVQLLQKRSKTKRSASGKRKRKSKQKHKAVFAVKLGAKPDKYPRLAQVSEGARGAVQLPDHARLSEISIQGHQLAMKSTMNASWDDQVRGRNGRSGARVVAMMLLSLYQVLNLARALDKKGQAA